MDETEYLLATQTNAEHLKKSIEQLKNVETQPHDLIEATEETDEE